MFILYAIPLGIVLGFALGGRLERLAAVRFRFAWLAAVALVVQLVLFSPIADGVSQDVVRPIYLASTALVITVVLANVRLAGVPLIILGAASNLAAVAANGGAMPAAPDALASLGLGVGGHTSSLLVDHPALELLTDRFALPPWMPMANVFSVGDVLIGAGVAIAIAAAMRSRPDPTSPPTAASDRPPIPTDRRA